MLKRDKRHFKKGPMLSFIVLFGLSLIGLTGCTSMTKTDVNSYADDKGIEIASAGILTKAPFEGVTRINVLSMDGNVLMVGQSPDPRLTAQAEKEIGNISGVKQVYNQIRQSKPIPLSQVAIDSWLTTKVKTHILTSSLYKDTAIKVLTENNEVFLLGYVTKVQADKAADLARQVDGVQQVVKVFQIIN